VTPKYPTDHEPVVEVRPALGRFEDFATVVGPQRAGAVEHATAHGAEVVEGYPVDTSGQVDQVSGYVGTVRLFEQAGFERAAPTAAP
jgi:hypothetical protein